MENLPDRLAHLTPIIHPIPPISETLEVIEEKAQNISHLRTILEEAEKDIRRLEQEVTNHYASIAPIRKIPVEILSRIFVFTAGNPGPQLSSSSTRARPENYRIMLVCKLWCKVTIGTPQLWNSYALSHRPKSLEFFETWVDRSGNLPLQIVFSMCGSEQLSIFQDKCKPYANRLHTLHLEDMGVAIYRPFNYTHTQSLSQFLATSSITDIRFSGVYFPLTEGQDLQQHVAIPTLRSFTGEAIHGLFPITSPSLETIRISRSSGISSRSLWNLINPSNRLQSLDLTDSSFESPGSTDFANLPSVGTLAIGTKARHIQDTFSRSLLRACTNVERLTLSFPVYFSGFTDGASPLTLKNLTVLTLNVGYANAWEYYGWGELEKLRPILIWLAAVETLEELTVYSMHNDDGLDPTLSLQALLIGNSPVARVPCPRLKVLKVEGTICWPSIYLRIMMERAASPEDIRDAGYDPEVFARDFELPRPFAFDIDVSVRRRNYPREYDIFWKCQANAWKPFWLSYQERCRDLERFSDDYFDELDFGMVQIFDEGDAFDRMRLLGNEISEAFLAAEEEEEPEEDCYGCYYGGGMYDSDELEDYGDLGFW